MIRVFCGFVVTMLLSANAFGQVIRLEAEDARLIGNVRVVGAGAGDLPARAGFSDRGFVTGIETTADRIEFRIPNVNAGLYSLRFGFTAPSAHKLIEIVVNDDLRHVSLVPQTHTTFRPHFAGRVELRDGENTVRFERGWGFYDLDYIELEPTSVPSPPKQPPNKLVNPNATKESREAFAMLINRYGKTCLSGVYSAEDAKLVQKVSGQIPAIMGGDLMDYSPSRVEYGVEKKPISEELIAQAREGYLLTISWHWNAPRGLLDKMITGPDGKEVDARWYKGFNTNATTFDVAAAMSDLKSDDYHLLVRDIDAIAIELRKLHDAKVPILWRPLHEADGKWFWWGAKGPEAYVKLWRLLYDRLVNHHQLHNLIWVYTGGPDYTWYPGDEFVDIVGIDAYPPDVRDPLSEFWDMVRAQYKDRKLLALTEFGGVPDIDRMRRHGVYWAYFTSWTGQSGPHKMKADALEAIYKSQHVENRGSR